MESADKTVVMMSAPGATGTAGRLGRRTFLAVMAWAAASLGLGGSRRAAASGALSWTVTRGFPDRPITARVHAPWLADGARVALTLEITTPREVIRRPAGWLRVQGGRGQAVVALAYPYPGRVEGLYSYRLVGRAGRTRLATHTAATYSVRRVVWFS